ncbi:MAG: ArsR family transcriptional regulator [Rhodospirillales bacterium]
MSFAEYVAEDIRLSILSLLAKDQGYSHNDRVLQRALEMLGHKVSADQVRTHLAWLADQGLVAVETVETFSIATLNQRGLDVAEGRALVPGVRRPQPGR